MTLPWLTYVEEASDVRDGTDIEMQLTFASEMKIVLAKYALDGTWLGMEEMSTQVRGCKTKTKRYEGSGMLFCCFSLVM